MSDDLTRTVREALAAATPGPWEAHGQDVEAFIESVGEYGTVCTAEDRSAPLIANAPTWLAQLADEVERLHEANLQSAIDALSSTVDAELLKTNIRLSGEVDALRARLDAAERAVKAVADIHRPIRVYDECDHEDCQADQIEVYDYTACADSAIGWACEACCYDGDMPREDCPHGGFHSGVDLAESCPTRAALDAYRAETGAGE